MEVDAEAEGEVEGPASALSYSSLSSSWEATAALYFGAGRTLCNVATIVYDGGSGLKGRSVMDEDGVRDEKNVRVEQRPLVSSR